MRHVEARDRKSNREGEQEYECSKKASRQWCCCPSPTRFLTFSARSSNGTIARTAVTTALRGTLRFNRKRGSLISFRPVTIWPDNTRVGSTTMAAIPGTGIGMTSGIVKNIRAVPNEVSPNACPISSSVKLSAFGFFVKMFRRISDVRSGRAERENGAE